MSPPHSTPPIRQADRAMTALSKNPLVSIFAALRGPSSLSAVHDALLRHPGALRGIVETLAAGFLSSADGVAETLKGAALKGPPPLQAAVLDLLSDFIVEDHRAELAGSQGGVRGGGGGGGSSSQEGSQRGGQERGSSGDRQIGGSSSGSAPPGNAPPQPQQQPPGPPPSGPPPPPPSGLGAAISLPPSTPHSPLNSSLCSAMMPSSPPSPPP